MKGETATTFKIRGIGGFKNCTYRPKPKNHTTARHKRALAMLTSLCFLFLVKM